MTAFVIGNGLSRKDINLHKLQGTTYGCNWLYTEFKPDVLVAVDEPISQYIQQSLYPKYHKFYTRRCYNDTGAIPLGHQHKNWASGSNALQLAVNNNHKIIILLGFDFGGDNVSNNIYAGTRFYKDANANSTSSVKWQSQIDSIFKSNCSKYVLFKIVVTTETLIRADIYRHLKNVELIDITDFTKEYLDNKDHK